MVSETDLVSLGLSNVAGGLWFVLMGECDALSWICGGFVRAARGICGERSPCGALVGLTVRAMLECSVVLC